MLLAMKIFHSYIAVLIKSRVWRETENLNG